MKRWLPSLALLAAGLWNAPAAALCIGLPVITASTLQFPGYDPVSASPTDGTGTVTVGCAGVGLLPSFTTSLGIGTGSSFAARQLANGAERLNYNLYRDAGRTLVWGDGSPGTVLQSFNALLSLGTVSYTVYGRIAAGQDRPAGTYNSTITVTVDF